MFPVVAPTLLLRKRMGHPHLFLIDAERVGTRRRQAPSTRKRGLATSIPPYASLRES